VELWASTDEEQSSDEPADNAPAPSDLAALVAAARLAADLSGVVAPSAPWLPPLPDVLPGPASGDPVSPVAGPDTLAFGLLDVPAAQAYAPLVVDLRDGGHWALVGGPRSGRTTALRSLAAAAARRGPQEIHLYGMDFGGGGLRGLTALPQCGTVVGGDDVPRVRRLLDRLAEEVTRRQELLAQARLGSVAEQRAASAGGAALPWMLLLVDGWEGLTAALAELDPAAGAEPFLRLLQEGPAAGLCVVLAGGRDLLTGRVASLVGHRVVLALPDRLDFGLAGIPPREVPGHLPPGRALVPTAAGVLEAQLALPGTEADAAGQAAALAALAQEAEQRDPVLRDPRPLRVQEMPAVLPWDVATAAVAEGVHPRAAGPLWTLVGLGGDDLRPLGVDPTADGPLLLIAGSARTGRSTALAAIGRWHGDRGVPVIAVAPRRSPLHRAAGSPDGPGGVWATDGTDPEALRALIAEARRTVARSGAGPLVLLVDDVEHVADTAAGDVLTDLVSASEPGELLVAVAGTAEAFTAAYRGLGALARTSRCALLLGRCGVAERDLAGTAVPRTAAGPPGRALLAVHGEVALLQVPLP
jgi:S-DNA-T family DNA segregation ATPase FtsK/SpoIIIE